MEAATGNAWLTTALLTVGVALIATTLPKALHPFLFAIGCGSVAAAFLMGTRTQHRRRRSGLRVTAALWGPPDHQADVAQTLNSLIRDGSLHTQATVGVLGDPLPGKGKYLTIFYEAFGEPHRIDLYELNSIDLP